MASRRMSSWRPGRKTKCPAGAKLDECESPASRRAAPAGWLQEDGRDCFLSKGEYLCSELTVLNRPTLSTRACGHGLNNATMKKHSRREIFMKLVHADELTRAGKSQVEVCKALGVSVMTLHRWRKLTPEYAETPRGDDAAEPSVSPNPPTMADMRRVLEELSDENRRLRKMVTDLLLERMRMEEATLQHGKEDTEISEQ